MIRAEGPCYNTAVPRIVASSRLCYVGGATAPRWRSVHAESLGGQPGKHTRVVSQLTIASTRSSLSWGSETCLELSRARYITIWTLTSTRAVRDFRSIRPRALCRLRRRSEAGYRVHGHIVGHGRGSLRLFQVSPSHERRSADGTTL